MFALPPDEPILGDLQSLSAAIDELCEIVGGDREHVVETLAQIIRHRVAFEQARRQVQKGGGRDA